MKNLASFDLGKIKHIKNKIITNKMNLKVSCTNTIIELIIPLKPPQYAANPKTKTKIKIHPYFS